MNNRGEAGAAVLELLGDPVRMTVDERVVMTAGCRDCDPLPRVAGAGKVFEQNGEKVQLMHCGSVVSAGGYYGSWMSRLIELLHGHHEPQEERVFAALLERLPPDAVMIEPGSFWAYYSLWFHRTIKQGFNLCLEPDLNYLQTGMKNFALNKYERVKFIHGAVGRQPRTEYQFHQESDGSNTIVPLFSFDQLVELERLERVDMAVLDLQGVELYVLHGMRELIRRQRIRFVIIATHHWSISGNFLTHQLCREFVLQNGGTVIAEFDVSESYSGDGMLAVSFDPRDSGLHIEVSRNTAACALFRPSGYDLALLTAHCTPEGNSDEL